MLFDESHDERGSKKSAVKKTKYELELIKLK